MPVVIENHISDVLRGNPLGDPHVRRTPIYLPPQYAKSNERYPTLYLLAGYAGRGTMILNDSAWDESFEDRMDRLIASGAIRPMMVVMPDCFTRYGGSQYINSTATGPYENYLVHELVPYVDRKYRTLADRNFRAICGKSSGGYGAVIQAMRHPDVFGLAADHSGDKYFELCYKPDFAKCLRGLARFGGLQKFMAQFPHPRPRPSTFFDVIAIAAMAACYSPDPASPVGFDLPFDEYTGEIRAEVWARWEAWDPVNLIEKYAEALRSLRLLYFECGTQDEFNLHYGARIFAKRLAAAGIPHQHVEFDDGHRDLAYRYDFSFRAISEAMQ